MTGDSSRHTTFLLFQRIDENGERARFWNENMQKTIRLRKGIRTTGIVCLLFFLSIGIASFVVGFFLEPPPNARINPIYVAIGFACFWSAMSSLAIWLLLTFWRGRVSLTDESVTQQGVLRTATIRFDEIERVTWKPAPSQIRLHTPTSRLKIDLSTIELADRLWLIRKMRDVQKPAHDGWEMFCVKIAVPLQQSEIQEGQSLDPDKVALTRKRWAWYFLPTTILFAIVGIVLSWMLHRPQMLAAPLPLLGLWAYLHFSTPQRGLATTRISAESGRSGFLMFLLIWCGIGLAANFFLAAMRLPPPQMIAWGVGGGLVWFSVLMYKAVQFDRQRERGSEDRIPAALAEWSNDGAIQGPSV